MLGKIKTIRGINWVLVALVGLTFAAVAFNRGVVSTAWVTASTIYMIALLALTISVLVAAATRTSLHPWGLLAAIYTTIFASVALVASFEHLKLITILGLACGLVLGTCIAILARRISWE